MMNQRGGVLVRIVLLILSLGIIGTLILWQFRNSQEQYARNHRKAMEISEYGLMTALGHLHANPSWREGIKREDYNDGWYSVSLEETNDNAKVMVKIRSLGHMGSLMDTKECILELKVQGAESTWVRKSLN